MTRIPLCLGVLLAALPVMARDWDVIRDGKAVPDGTTDSTAAFQRLLDEAAQAGGIVHVPAGRYRIDGVLRIPGGVTLQGTFRVPPTDQRETELKLDGSVLMAFAGRGSKEGEPFIRLAGSMATIAGFRIVYPEWKQADVPPVPYPPTIRADGTANAGVLDCCIVNAYEAIHFQGAARFLVRNVHGYPSFRGLFVDECYDIGRVENCHFWPFGVAYNAKDPYCKWVNENGVAFEFARTDWQYVLNTFCFGYGVGYKFSSYKHGGCNGNFVGIGADCCRRAVLVADCQPFGLLITNGEFVGRWENDDSAGVEIAEASGEGKVSLVNCAFWGPLDRGVWLRGAKVQFTATACHFQQWDVGRRGSPAVQADAGRAIVQGNTFGNGDLHVRVGAKARSVIVMGNQADGGIEIDNQAGGRTQVLANEGAESAFSEEARANYRLDLGSPGDANYVRHWHTGERAGFWPDGKAGTMRWSTHESILRLPVPRQKACTVSLDAWVTPQAIDATAGVYLGTKRIAEMPAKEGAVVITGTIPAGEADRVTLVLRVKGWRPMDVCKGSGDARTLGIAVRQVRVQAQGAGPVVHCANTGEPVR